MTYIALVRTKDFIAVAADSSVVDQNDIPLSNSLKIVPTGKFFCIPNKLAGDVRTGYDIWQIVRDIGPQESLDGLVKTLKKVVPQPLANTLALISANPQTFKQKFPNGQVLGLAVIGIENGVLCLVDLRFFVVILSGTTVGLNIEEKRCPGKDCSADVDDDSCRR